MRALRPSHCNSRWQQTQMPHLKLKKSREFAATSGIWAIFM